METFRFWCWFSVLCIACAFAGVSSVFLTIGPANAATDPAPPIVYDVKDDPGGSVLVYYEVYKRLSDRGATVRIRGYCASACTLVLLREYTGIKACAYEDAMLAFHKPYQMDGEKVVRTEEAIQSSRELWTDMLVNFPYDVFNILKNARIPSPAEGADKSDMFVVPAIFFLPKCAS